MTTTTTDPDVVAERLVGVGMRLAALVQLYDPDESAELVAGLTPEELRALPFVLAGLIDITRTREEMLAWVEGGHRAPAHLRYLTSVAPAPKLLGEATDKHSSDLCGTRRGYLLHVRRDETCPSGDCEIANRAWERTRRRDRQEWESRQDGDGQAQLPIDDDPEETTAHAA